MDRAQEMEPVRRLEQEAFAEASRTEAEWAEIDEDQAVRNGSQVSS